MMLYGIELGSLSCYAVWEEKSLFSHKKILESDFLLTLLRKKEVLFFQRMHQLAVKNLNFFNALNCFQRRFM